MMVVPPLDSVWILSGPGSHLDLDGFIWVWMDPSGFEWIHLGLGFGCCVDSVWVGPEWALHAMC